MSNFSSLSPEELSILANIIAIALAKNRTPDEVNVLGNLTASVGALLLTIAAQQQSLQTMQDNLNQANQSDKKSR